MGTRATKDGKQVVSPKERLFIDAFCGAACGNATRAADMAGYSNPNAHASEIRHRPLVAAEIERILTERAMPQGDVLARLGQQGRAEYAAFFTVQNGRLVLDHDGLLAAGLGHLVKSFKQTKAGQTVEFYDAQAALVQIGRHYKLFADKTVITVNEFDGLTDDEVEQIAGAGTAGAPSAGSPGVEAPEA